MSNIADAVLGALPGTVKEISQKLGWTNGRVWDNVAYLRKTGRLHVGGWQRRGPAGGHFCKVYHAGPGPDVPCDLVPMDNTQTKRAFRERRAERELQLEREREMSRRIPPRDPLTAALYGSPT